ncbi:PQQ-binding-like beta-propeller repeat protein [Verrucomicrobiota bacterium]
MSDDNGNEEALGAARSVYHILLGIGIAAGVFTAAVCILMIATFVQLRTNDPLDNPVLVELREEYSADMENEKLQKNIRWLDYRLRTVYFRDQAQIVTGGYLAVIGAVIMCTAWGIGQALQKKLPLLEDKVADEAFWGAISGSRGWIAGAGVLVAALTAYLAFSTDTNLPTDASLIASLPKKAPAGKAPDKAPDKPQSDEPKPAPTQADTKPEAKGPSAEELLKNCTVFRGPTGAGYSKARNVPIEWSEQDNRNILWKAAIPLGGLSSPVTWGDKVFLSGATQEKREVYCLSAKDGSVVWTGTYKTSEEASTDYEVYADLEALMHAAATPAVDGKHLYAIFANGELVAFDIKTGKAVWSKVVGDTTDNMYGLSNSLLIYDGSVICAFDGDSYTLSRFDGATGEKIWRSERDDNTWASPILIKTADKKTLVINAGNEEVSGWDADTGKKAWGHDLLMGDIAPSPTAGGGLVFANFQDCGIFGIDPKGKSRIAWTIDELDQGAFSDTTSMVTDGKFLYQFQEDMLACIDAAEGKVFYEQAMDGSTSYASPTIVGDKLYIFCGDTTYVVKVGPKHQLLKTNTLDEYTDSSPAVVDGRMYIRTEKSLYAVGE